MSCELHSCVYIKNLVMDYLRSSYLRRMCQMSMMPQLFGYIEHVVYFIQLGCISVWRYIWKATSSIIYILHDQGTSTRDVLVVMVILGNQHVVGHVACFTQLGCVKCMDMYLEGYFKHTHVLCNQGTSTRDVLVVMIELGTSSMRRHVGVCPHGLPIREHGT